MKKKYDVTIIGSGLTGLSASLALSSLGYTVALVDPKSLVFNQGEYNDNRTTAISSGSANFYKEIGVWKLLEKHACPIKKILVEEQSSYLQSIFQSENSSEKTMGYMIENINLFKSLLSLTKKNKNIFKYDCRIISYSRTHNRVEVILDNGKLIDCKLIIGADGKNSFLRKLCKISYKYKNYNQKAFTFCIKHKNNHNNLAIEKFLKDGPLAVLPVSRKKSNKYSSVVWSCNHPTYYQYMKNGEKKIEQIIQDFFSKIYGKIEIASKIETWNLSLVHAQRYIDHRILLLGDAAHSIHPLAGQGFNLTLRGIEKIHGYAIKEIRISKDIGKKKYLMNYSKKHYIDASILIFVTDKLNLLFSNSNFLLKRIRRGGLRIFSKSKLIKKIFRNYATKGTAFSIKGQ